MKHLKTYNQLNEGLRDKMKGKSDEEVLSILNKLENDKKIEYIIKHKLNYNYLPRDEYGWCIHYGDLKIDNSDIVELPNKLQVNGKLYVPVNNLTILPNDLIVSSNINVSYNELSKLPDNLTVNGNLHCVKNKLTELPKGLHVKGKLMCNGNMITELPEDLIVDGILEIENNPISRHTKIPKGVDIKKIVF